MLLGRGRGAFLGRGGGFGGGCAWWWRFLVVALLPLGAWVMLGVALSPWWWVGLVVAISLGSVRGVGVEWWLRLGVWLGGGWWWLLG